MNAIRGKKTIARKAPTRISAPRLDEMIEEAVVDRLRRDGAGDGWFTMFEDHLELPFDTMVLGVPVRVIRIDHRDDGRLVAICARGNDEQAIGLADLPLPTPMPEGAEWIEAYRRWIGRR